jgi:hypothetical protein
VNSLCDQIYQLPAERIASALDFYKSYWPPPSVVPWDHPDDIVTTPAAVKRIFYAQSSRIDDYPSGLAPGVSVCGTVTWPIAPGVVINNAFHTSLIGPGLVPLNEVWLVPDNWEDPDGRTNNGYPPYEAYSMLEGNHVVFHGVVNEGGTPGEQANAMGELYRAACGLLEFHARDGSVWTFEQLDTIGAPVDGAFGQMPGHLNQLRLVRKTRGNAWTRYGWAGEHLVAIETSDHTFLHYDFDGDRLTQVTDEQGYQVTIAYDGVGFPYRVDKPGGSLDLHWDDHGNLATVENHGLPDEPVGRTAFLHCYGQPRNVGQANYTASGLPWNGLPFRLRGDFQRLPMMVRRVSTPDGGALTFDPQSRAAGVTGFTARVTSGGADLGTRTMLWHAQPYDYDNIEIALSSSLSTDVELRTANDFVPQVVADRGVNVLECVIGSDGSTEISPGTCSVGSGKSSTYYTKDYLDDMPASYQVWVRGSLVEGRYVSDQGNGTIQILQDDGTSTSIQYDVVGGVWRRPTGFTDDYGQESITYDNTVDPPSGVTSTQGAYTETLTLTADQGYPDKIAEIHSDERPTTYLGYDGTGQLSEVEDAFDDVQMTWGAFGLDGVSVDGMDDSGQPVRQSVSVVERHPNGQAKTVNDTLGWPTATQLDGLGHIGTVSSAGTTVAVTPDGAGRATGATVTVGGVVASSSTMTYGWDPEPAGDLPASGPYPSSPECQLDGTVGQVLGIAKASDQLLKDQGKNGVDASLGDAFQVCRFSVGAVGEDSARVVSVASQLTLVEDDFDCPGTCWPALFYVPKRGLWTQDLSDGSSCGTIPVHFYQSAVLVYDVCTRGTIDSHYSDPSCWEASFDGSRWVYGEDIFNYTLPDVKVGPACSDLGQICLGGQ